MQVRELAGTDAPSVLATWNQAVALARVRGCAITAALVQEVLGGNSTLQHQLPIHLSSACHHWHTPPSFLSLVTAVFQGQKVDLDPCSDQAAQQHICARKYYTAVDDGLSRPWEGRVFVNPPFGAEGGHSLSGAFFQKAEREYQQGTATEILLVLKAAIGYAWFKPILQWPHAWLHARIAFLPHGQQARVQNPHGSIVVYLGPHVKHFCQVFSAVASIPGANSWSCNRIYEGE